MNYQVVKKQELGNKDMEALVNLYLPLIGTKALNIYLTLYYSFESATFNDLSLLINEDTKCIKASTNILEQYFLLDTYQKGNDFVFLIKQPLLQDEFMAHEILGRLLFKKMGKVYFEKVTKYYDQIELDTFEKVSCKVNCDILKFWNSENEQDFNMYFVEKNNSQASFNRSQLFDGLSNMMFPFKLRTNKVINLIMEMAGLYNIDLVDVKKMALQSIDVERCVFDDAKFKYRARKYNKPALDIENKYLLPCDQFLLRFANLSKIDNYSSQILEEMKSTYDLTNEVINVIVEYVLKSNNMDLNKAFIYKIASQFNRLQITTYDKALDSINNRNNYSKKSPVSEPLPQWAKKYENGDAYNKIKDDNDDLDLLELMKGLK